VTKAVFPGNARTAVGTHRGHGVDRRPHGRLRSDGVPTTKIVDRFARSWRSRRPVQCHATRSRRGSSRQREAEPALRAMSTRWRCSARAEPEDVANTVAFLCSERASTSPRGGHGDGGWICSRFEFPGEDRMPTGRRASTRWRPIPCRQVGRTTAVIQYGERRWRRDVAPVIKDGTCT